MHPADQEQPLWTLVRLLEWETLEAWRKRYHAAQTREGIFAEHLTCIETTVTRRPLGNILVTVSILATKVFECEVQAFRLQRTGNNVYRVLEEG